ncbi:unnamed protein product [Arabis nemorensis]|uniref:Uncharacterized protein n=1 Tax=Arabis nemorensis TaxID=586526 RepID=A0A565CMH2_9BRAS|nr:unnamed protein product [Arabis nemorensis]
MDFHSLMRRDLQFLCKRNKIPANMTNLAMADALKALEIVEGLDEYMTQSNSNAPRSPTSLANQPPNTATRTTRRKTTMKAEPQSSSQLVSRSTNKSLAGEMDQENINKNVAQEPKTNNVKFEANVAKTPATRSIRKASAATSCSRKVQESKKKEPVQSVYSTRRSTRLLEKCMGELSLKTKETLDDKLEKNEETERKVSALEENTAGSEEKSEEAEVIPGRDLSASMEKEWKILKNDSDKVDENAGDIAVVDANTETNMEKVNEVMSDEKESENSLVQVDKQEETLQTDEAIMCEEGSKKNDNYQEIGDIEVYVDLGDIPVLEQVNTENNNGKKESKNVIGFESVVVQVDQQETEQVTQEKDSDSVAEKINTLDEEIMMDQQETEQVIQEKDSVAEKINSFDEEIMVDQTSEEDNSGVDSDSTVSEADSNQAVMGSDIADEEMILSESEGSDAAPRASSPPLLLEESKVKTSPFAAAESISVQFPRPSKSTTSTPLKNSALKLMVNVDNENKENNMEMMMMMNVVNNENGESKVEAKKKMKKVVEIDEVNLNDVSMRQLVKMVKQLSIKTSNRPALQMLPGNNQIAE